LSRSAEFDRVYRQGRSVANRYLVLYSFPRGGEATPRLGLSVGRKVGGAVERNLARGYDIVVVARADAGALAATRGLAGISEAVGELLAKAGLRSPATTR